MAAQQVITHSGERARIDMRGGEDAAVRSLRQSTVKQRILASQHSET